MSISSDLLEAIIANPHDDAARLVYADALTAAGNPRGEFIVIQVELARMGVSSLDDIVHLESDADVLRAATLWRRQEALLRNHDLTWLNETFGALDFYERRVRFRRGFVHHVALKNDADAHLLSQIVHRRSGPLVESIDIAESLTDESVELVVLATQGALKTLSVSPRRITDEGLERLMASALAGGGGLRSLKFNQLSVAMLSTPNMQSLRELDLSFSANDLLAVLKALPKEITSLGCSLNDDPFGHDAIAGLLDSPIASSLESLEVRGVKGLKSIEALANSTRLSSLEKLLLHGTIEGEALAMLANARSARPTTLCLSHVNRLDEKNLTALFATRMGGTLRNLKIQYMSSSYYWINDRDLLPTLAEHAPTSLRSLSLDGFNLTSPENLAALLKAPRLSKLRRLCLARAMGNAGARVVSEAPLPNLVEISLTANGIRREGVRGFLNANDRFPALASLHLGVDAETDAYLALYNNLGEEGAFRKQAELLMPSGKPYYTNRDGKVVISWSGGTRVLIEEDIVPLIEQLGINVVVTEPLMEAGVKLTDPAVEPIAITITRDKGKVVLHYFVSDRHPVWPTIKQIARQIATSLLSNEAKITMTDDLLRTSLEC